MSPHELSDADRTRVLALLAEVAAHDGVDPLSEEHLLALRGPDPQVWLARARSEGPDDSDNSGASPGSGVIVGVASRSGRAVEVAVHPDHRRRGHGRALLTAALGLDLDLDLDETGAPHADRAVWAHGDLPPARALAAHLGLERARELLRLEKRLAPEDAALPRMPDVTALADAPEHERAGALAAWLRLNGIAFADHPEQGRWTSTDVAARLAEPWFDPALLYLVPRTDRDELLASLWVKPDHTDRGRAEIYVLAVHPDAAGQGLGRALLQHVLGELAREGVVVVDLYTSAENERAVRLYERTGFRVVERHGQYARPAR